ncbi:unnamed protein product [Calypogeia fissa]
MGNASEATVKLITNRCSPFAQRVHTALMEKNISFESVHVDYVNKPKLLLETNPVWTKIPVLIHDDKSVSESLIILEYLDEVWPTGAPLMPTDAYEKSKVRFWADYINKEFTAYTDYLKFAYYVKLSSDLDEKKQAGKDATIKFIKTLNGAMNGFSAEGPFFTGAQFGFLDVVLAVFVGTLPLAEAQGFVIPNSDEVPRFLKWVEAVRARPSVSANTPSVEEYFSYKNKQTNVDVSS